MAGRSLALHESWTDPRDDRSAVVRLAGLGGNLLGRAIVRPVGLGRDPFGGDVAVGGGAVAELLADVVEPLVFGERVGAELLELPFLLAEEQGPVLPQLARGRRIDQVARVVGAHLEQDADLELAEP